MKEQGLLLKADNLYAASSAEPDGLPAFANRYLYESSTF